MFKNINSSRAYKNRVINWKSKVKSTRWEFFQKYLGSQLQENPRLKYSYRKIKQKAYYAGDRDRD